MLSMTFFTALALNCGNSRRINWLSFSNFVSTTWQSFCLQICPVTFCCACLHKPVIKSINAFFFYLLMSLFFQSHPSPPCIPAPPSLPPKLDSAILYHFYLALNPSESTARIWQILYSYNVLLLSSAWITLWNSLPFLESQWAK